jgi:hypothetical protein
MYIDGGDPRGAEAARRCARASAFTYNIVKQRASLGLAHHVCVLNGVWSWRLLELLLFILLLVRNLLLVFLLLLLLLPLGALFPSSLFEHLRYE